MKSNMRNRIGSWIAYQSERWFGPGVSNARGSRLYRAFDRLAGRLILQPSPEPVCPTTGKSHRWYSGGHSTFCVDCRWHKDRTPRERWGTCCPHDPECEHSFMENDELTRWMDTPITDDEASRLSEK